MFLKADAMDHQEVPFNSYQPTTATMSLQLCMTLCNPIDCSPPGSSDHRILQARILEWVAISFSTKQGLMASTSLGHERAQERQSLLKFSTQNKAWYPGSFPHTVSSLRAMIKNTPGGRQFPWGKGAECSPPQSDRGLENTGAQVNNMYLYLKVSKGKSQWTWVWMNSGSWWWTGRPGVLQPKGSQRVRHDWATEVNWNLFISS